VSGGIITSETGRIHEQGLVWSTSPHPEKGKNSQAPGNGRDFLITMTGLSSNTGYYVRAFASNQGGTAYGEEFFFTTLPHIEAEVTTSQVSDITFKSAIVSGKVISSGTSAVTEVGVVYGNSPGVTLNNSKVQSGFPAIKVTIGRLNESTTYYVRAYVITGAGVSYGEELNFSTPSSLSVNTLSATKITYNSASVSAEVLVAGSPVIERGVAFAEHELPTIEGTKATSGSGEGVFTADIFDLKENTKYFARPYATNAFGTVYGDEISFVTKVKALPVTFLYDWFDLNGNHRYIISDQEIIFIDTYISYIYDEESITLESGVYKVVGRRIGWRDPVTFSFKQGADLNELSIGSRLSSTQKFWKVVGRNVIKVTWGTGAAGIRWRGENTWVEKDDAGQELKWIWTETSRDNWSVYLSRDDGARMRIDVGVKAIFFSSTPTGQLEELFKLTSWDY
jgi:hypothetical protein